MNKKASFCISIDCELSWGVKDKLSKNFLTKTIELDEHICKTLLKVFNDFNIDVTWAVVAAMLDPHNPMIKIFDPKAWYNPNIINSILESKNNHEIASHTYAHPNFNHHNEEYIDNDFMMAEKFFNQNGITINSFVFPRNQIRYLNLLTKYNINVFRSLDNSWYRDVFNYNNFLGKISNIIDKALPIKTNTVTPKLINNNLYELQSSLLFISRNGYKRIISEKSILYKTKYGIDKAIRNKECFHLWFHPSNFYYNTEKQFLLLKKILTYVDLNRKRGLISVNTLDTYQF